MENLDLVSLDVSISPSYCIRGIANEVNVLCKVKTGHKPEIEALKHTPLNLAIVLDRSGSMSGQKIENAKLAIEQVISSLYKDDVFHLVCFASDVEVVIEGASLAKDSLDDILTKVKGIKATTCTNLWGGTERGAELIKQYHAADGSAKDRLFLFSDGLVNEGEQNQQTILRKVSDLMERGTLVSAFGIGDDFDETLMRGIADKGLGAYFFIENAQMIPSFVQFALHSIQTMVGDQACLIARGQNGACVDKFYGDTFDLIHGAKLGDLRSDNVRTVMLKMTVNGTSVTASALGEEEVLLVEMTWRDGEAEHVLSKALKVCYTTDPIDVEKSRVPEITVQLALQRSVKINEKLAKISDDNKKAIELQEELIQVFESVVEIDNNNLDGANKIEKFLKSAKADLEKLKSKGISKATQKEAHHKGYMVRRG